MEKKNPFVTTIGFKKEDPDHVYVAELLNSMGRGKAQYIVKAVLVYQKMQQEGEVPQTSGLPYDYQSIRRVVLQVLEEQKGQSGGQSIVSQTAEPESIPEKEPDLLLGFNESDISGIMASLAAFQEQ